MLTPRASFGLEEPFPDDEPTSDAPCRPAGTPASAPCRAAAVSMRIRSCERRGTSRVHPRNQDVSEIDRLRSISSASGAPTVVSRHHRFRGGWILVADSTPQTSIAHPFTSIPPSVRVNGAMGSFVARGPLLLAFRRKDMNLEDACDQPMPFTRYRQAPASRSVTDPIELSPVASVCGALHGAPHASAIAPAERSASDASVTHPTIAGTLDADASGRMGQDHFSRAFVKKERLLRPEAPSIDRKPRDRDTLSGDLEGWCRFRGFATTTRPPTPFRPARSPACGLAPVHCARENTQAASLSVGAVERLLQHDTKRGHTLRDLRTSHVGTGQSRDTPSLANRCRCDWAASGHVASLARASAPGRGHRDRGTTVPFGVCV